MHMEPLRSKPGTNAPASAQTPGSVMEAIPARIVTCPRRTAVNAAATHNYYPAGKSPEQGRSKHRPAKQCERLEYGQSRHIRFATKGKHLHLLSNKHVTHRTCFQTGFHAP